MLAMTMSGSNGIFSVPSEHRPGLVVLVVIAPVLWLALSALRARARAGSAPALRCVGRYDGLSFTAKAVLFATLVGATVHIAIVPTHWGDERVTAILFIVDAVAFLIAFFWTFTCRNHWRLVVGSHHRRYGGRLRLLHTAWLGDHGPGRPADHHH